jgi:hypothetical protein
VSDLRPDQAAVQMEHRIVHPIAGHLVIYMQHSEVRSDETDFHYTARRWVTQNGKVVREKTWSETIPRSYR